jgi:DNA-binding SARP family transcriptional activator/TolB-like protein
MIQLRLLGSLALTGPAGEELPAVLRQPKRLALLAYLAVASPRGFHRRDTLLALFWPERDTEHARAALSHGLYTLRRTLGEGVIVSRGDEEVGIDRELCWCDAVALEEAVDAGRLEEAIGLYRGELFAGFHLSDAPEFDRWLEEHRARVRDRVTQAALALADQEEARGRLPAAARWARYAVGLSPYEESGVRRLMALLERTGNRAEAVREYERFARHLASDLELEPSTETVALMEGIRTRRGSRGTQETPSRLSPEPPATDGLGPEVTAAPPVRVVRPGLQRRRGLVALALSIVGLALLGLSLVRSSGPPRIPPSRAAIAVLPFAYRGSPKFSYLGEGLVDLLSAKLEGAPGLRPVDSRTLLTFASREGSITDPQRGALVAQRFGAGLFVLGSITEAGGRLGVSATVYEAEGRPRNSFEAMAGGEEEIFDLADRLARQILAEAQDKPLQLARVAGQATTSLPALKAYLEGEREGRAGRGGTAEEAWRRAVELDTSFALAYYRLAGFNIYGDPPLAQEMVDRALRHSDRLGEHHRALLVAMAALVRGDHAAAAQQYRVILAAHPDDAEAWFILGWLTQEKAHLLGRAWVDAREPYERALALDPRSAAAVFWLAAIAAREGRRTDLDSLTDRLLRLNPHPYWAGTARGQRAVALGDTAGEARFVAELRTRPDGWAQTSGGLVLWTTGNLSAGRRLWGLITEPTRSLGFRAMAHATLAKIELTNGRWDAASAELEALKALDRGAALEHRAHYRLTRFLEAPRSELMALRDSLRRWDPSSARTEGDGLFPVHRGLHRYLRLYLLGLLSARLRDEPAVLRYVAELERVDRSSPPGRFAADKAQVIRSELAWIRGRRQEALTLLEGAQFWTNNSGLEQGGSSELTTNFHERFARPELLYELGREDEALPWYRSLAYDLLYTGLAELRLGQIYEHKGDRRRAIEHYSRFVELWRESDPELQPMVSQAQQALARLR